MGKNREVLEISKINGAINRKFESVTEARKEVGISETAMLNCLIRNQLPRGRFLYHYADTWSGEKQFSKKNLNRPLVVISNENKTVNYYFSTREAAEKSFVNYDAFKKALGRGNGRAAFKRLNMCAFYIDSTSQYKTIKTVFSAKGYEVQQ